MRLYFPLVDRKSKPFSTNLIKCCISVPCSILDVFYYLISLNVHLSDFRHSLQDSFSLDEAALNLPSKKLASSSRISLDLIDRKLCRLFCERFVFRFAQDKSQPVDNSFHVFPRKECEDFADRRGLIPGAMLRLLEIEGAY